MSEYNNKKIVQEVSGGMKSGWKWLMVIGILTLLLGIVGMGMNISMTMVSIFVVGLFLFFGGILHLIDVFIVEGWKKKFSAGLISVMYVIAGILMIKYPAASAAWFTLFVAAFFIVIGIFRLIFGFSLRKEGKGWVWTVISGVAAVLIGILIYAEWPVSGLWVIGLFVSIELIMQGVYTITVALAARSVQRKMERSAP